MQKIRDARGVAENGLMAIWSTLEMIRSFDVDRRNDWKTGMLVRRPRECLHDYFYFDDGRFGLTQVWLSTFFSFDCQVLVNGREWLTRQLDAQRSGYLRRDNCLTSTPVAHRTLRCIMFALQLSGLRTWREHS